MKSFPASVPEPRSPDQGPGSLIATIGADKASELLLVRDPSISVDTTRTPVSMPVLLCVAVLILMILQRKLSASTKSKKTIPVAFSLPWIGNLSLLRGLPHLVVSSLSEKYGKIFRLNAGGDRNFVILNDIGLVREAMRKFPSAMTGKPQTTTTKMTNAGAQQDMGKRWAKRRHITMTAIKNIFRHAADTVHESFDFELEKLVKKIARSHQTGQEPMQDITTFVARTVWRLVYGQGKEPDDKTARQLGRLADEVDNYTLTSGPFCLLDRFPFINKFISNAMSRYQNAVQFMNNFCEQNEEKRKSDPASLSGPHKDIMGFLNQGCETLTKADKDELGLDKELMLKGLCDLVRAGTESASLLIIWICLVLAKYPDVQKKMAAEIDANHLSSGDVTICEVPMERMPYTHAVIYETIRYCSVIPFLKRRTLDNVQIGGHELPMGTDVIINNHAISHDASRWGDPEVFRPERFIQSEDGHFDMHQLEKFLPYGIGKRRCMGEEIGKLIPFAGIATLVLNFNIIAPKDKAISLSPSFGMTLTPKHHKLTFENRRQKNIDIVGQSNSNPQLKS